MEQISCGYLVAVNLLGLAVMGADKRKAQHHRFRIPERSLFLIALLGGSMGIWAGMYVFCHKTRHLKFVVGMPVIFAAQAVLGYLLFCR